MCNNSAIHSPPRLKAIANEIVIELTFSQETDIESSGTWRDKHRFYLVSGDTELLKAMLTFDFETWNVWKDFMLVLMILMDFMCIMSKWWDTCYFVH